MPKEDRSDIFTSKTTKKHTQWLSILSIRLTNLRTGPRHIHQPNPNQRIYKDLIHHTEWKKNNIQSDQEINLIVSGESTTTHRQLKFGRTAHSFLARYCDAKIENVEEKSIRIFETRTEDFHFGDFALITCRTLVWNRWFPLPTIFHP